MSYIKESLGDGETIIAEAHFPWTYSALAWAALIFLGIILIGIVIFISMMVKRRTTEIGVTSHRFVEKKGLIATHTNEIALPNIEGVEGADQGRAGADLRLWVSARFRIERHRGWTR